MSNIEMSLTGRIVEWQGGRGFGCLECGGRRVFLHVREFKERHKQPEVGDVIRFVLGEDRQGRVCAKEAIHANDGGRLRIAHLAILAALLVLPGVAMYRTLGTSGARYTAGWFGLISGLTFLIYVWDKRQARKQGWREPEYILHLLELLGGWPGAFLAQRYLRHKATKGTYQFVFVLIVGLYQLLAIDALCGWPAVSAIVRTIRTSL